MPKPFFAVSPIEFKSQSVEDPSTRAIGLPDAKVDKDMEEGDKVD
jgi:hypothetical protein